MLTLALIGCTQTQNQSSDEENLPYDDEQDAIFCAQDVKQCADGTFVSRDPEKNCEFEPCPELETCDAVKECSAGKACYKFEDQDTPTCYIGDPCNNCPSGECRQAESYPPQIFCE